MPRSRTVQFTSSAIPGAVFFSLEALAEFAGERLKYENACRTLALDADRDAFEETLRGLGYEWSEIKAHFDRPRFRLKTAYA